MRKLFSIILLLICITGFGKLVAQVNCDNDSLGLIPIQDLGTDFYLGTYQGGMYPGGVNTPPTGHLKKGLSIVKKLKPLDTLGLVNYETGKIICAGFGASTVGGPFNHMIQLTNDDHTLNRCMQMVNTANGSDGLEELFVDNVDYWEYIRIYKLAIKGLTPNQVQVAWLMHSSRIDSNSADTGPYIDSLVKRFKIALQSMQIIYPNLKVVFLSGFPFGGYADSMKVLYHVIAEPASYNHNFAVKQVIKDQISGDPALRYMEPGKVAPYLAWGPPLWADGNIPNEYSGLSWECSEFTPDGGGYHMTSAGKDKVGEILIDFFKTDTLTEGWYNDGPKWITCGTGRNADGSIIIPKDVIIDKDAVTIYPNPSSGEFYVDFEQVLTSGINIKVLNNIGEVVYFDNYHSATPYSGYRFNLNGKPNGIYYFEVVINDQIFTQPVILNK